MVSPDARTILDQVGIEVVRAVYAKTLAVRVLPRDYADPVEFSTGTVQLGEVDIWLEQHTKRATEQRQSERRVSLWIMWIAVATLLVAAATGGFTWWQWNESQRPKLVTTDARLYINHAGNPPPELVQLFWRNGERAAFRGAATVFTVSEDGNQHEKFGLSEITVDWQNTSTTLLPFGSGYAQIPVDMNKFLGMFLVCAKYYDEANHSYRQAFLFRRGTPFNDHILTRLDELPSKRDACKRASKAA
jgi:hypothetical protein